MSGGFAEQIEQKVGARLAQGGEIGSIRVESKLCASSEAVVYKGRFGQDQCAVKVFDVSSQNFKNVKSELTALGRLKSEFVVNILDMYLTDYNCEVLPDDGDHAGIMGCLCFVAMEYASLGSLTEVIAERGAGVGLKENEVRHIVRQLLVGLHDLHENGIIHRDFKTDNILVFGSMQSEDASLFQVKIADFGHSKVSQEPLGESKTATTTAAQTDPLLSGSTIFSNCRPNNFAPELSNVQLRSQFVYSNATDFWSLGYVAFVMLCGEWPFNAGPRARWHARLDELHRISFDDQTTVPQWTRLSPESRDFVNHLLVLEPLHRMTVTVAAQHVWVNKEAMAIPVPERWHEIDLYSAQFCCNCDGKAMKSIASDHIVTLRCALVNAHLPTYCFVGARSDIEQVHPGHSLFKEMISDLPDASFLNIGFCHKKTVMYAEDKGEHKWVGRDTRISRGCTLHYGERCAMSTLEDVHLDQSNTTSNLAAGCTQHVNQTSHAVIGEFEQSLKVSSVTHSTLNCIELEVPAHFHNCVLGGQAQVSQGQGFLAFRRNWPKLASIVAIIRRSEEAGVKRINFPGGADVLYHGDLILLPHMFDDSRHGLDVESVQRMLDSQYFDRLCSSNDAKPPGFQCLQYCVEKLHREFSMQSGIGSLLDFVGLANGRVSGSDTIIFDESIAEER